MSVQYEYSGPKPQKSAGPLVIDDEVALWLMRMCAGEGGEDCQSRKSACLLWAITNRWFLRPGSRLLPTFIDLIRNFSQPVNPRWGRGGDLAIKYAGHPEASEAKLDRREHISSLNWPDVVWSIRSSVAAFSEGRLAYPVEAASLERPRISNWASLASTPRLYPWGVAVLRDWFFEDDELITGNVVVAQIK